MSDLEYVEVEVWEFGVSDCPDILISYIVLLHVGDEFATTHSFSKTNIVETFS